MDTPRRSTTFVVERSSDVGRRVDVVVARSASVSRRTVRLLARQGALFIDGQPAAAATRVCLGQRIELACRKPAIPVPEPTVLAHSDGLVYVYKPAGMHTHTLRPDDVPALSDCVAIRFPECALASHDSREGGAVHRLDRDTTGVVAFARNRSVWERARQALSSGLVTKLYLAVVDADRGWPPPAPANNLPGGFRIATEPAEIGYEPAILREIENATGRTPAGCLVDVRAPLGRGSARDRVAVRVDGAPARTLVQPLTRDTREPLRKGVTLLLARLITGHRHQARVHLAWMGIPVFGDARYGSATPEPRLMLHAFLLDFSRALPEERPVTAAPPIDVLALVDADAR